MTKELAPVGDGDQVSVRLAPKKGHDVAGLPPEGYHCSVSMDAPLEMLQLSLSNELSSIGVSCSSIVLHADNRRLEGAWRLEEGCCVLPTAKQRRLGRRLEIAFSLEGYQAKPPSPKAPVEATWGLPKRYILGQELGRGAYGEVREARDTTAGEAVAVKRIRCFFDNLVEAKRLLREVRIVRRIKNDNLVRLRGICLGEGDSSTSFDKVFLVFDKCDGDLQHMISAGAALEEARLAALLQGILGGLACLHSFSILHRDLKPANCLLKGDRLLLTDLGLSRQAPPVCATVEGLPAPPELQRQFSRHVVTRWYRPPELLLSSEQYGEPVDIWAAGCIFGELLQLTPSGGPSQPLFPGTGSSQSPAASSLDPAGDMLAVIVRVLGPASEADKAQLEESSRWAVGCAERSAASAPGQALNGLVPKASAGAFGLLQEMLAFGPARRPRARQALDHEFLAGLPRLPPTLERALTASPGFEAPDEELQDPSKHNEFLAELRSRFQEELDACCG